MKPTDQLTVIDSGTGCACCSGNTATTTTSTSDTKETPMSTQSFSVTGMTCGHCVGAVTEELEQLPGVTDVQVDLVAGGTSTVTISGDSPIDAQAVAAALDEAGDYQLASS